MLIIGTLISMITAVAVTRALLGVLAGFRWFNNPSFMGASAQKIPAWQRVDFVGRAKYWFAVSGVVVLIGIGSLAIQGLNLGIDFKGGSQFSFKTPQAHQIQDVRAQTTRLGIGDAVIQGRGPVENGAYKEFQVRTASLGQQAQTELTAALTSNLDATSVGVKNVSASFSRQILKGAILAIFVSLALIVIYVTLRFEFKFAMPVLIALVHDILITLGIYSLTQREVTSATVAAVLTILGYSIYDTIIIFDRVRENIPIMRAVLRRTSGPRHSRLSVRDLEIDLAARIVTVGGDPVQLSAKEYELLVALAEDPERVFRKEDLLRDVWGFRSLGRTRTLDSHASRLRRKLNRNGDAGYVLNVWGVGYRLTAVS